VQVYAGYVVHVGTLTGRIAVHSTVRLRVDYRRRKPIMSNHTSTHMVNFALREILGEGSNQKGSQVLPDKFRFEFSHGSALGPEQLSKVDQIVQHMIRNDLQVYTKEMPLKLAKKIKGLRAVFGEVYPDPVRVVSIGVDTSDLEKNPKNTEWLKFSIELCGGTHLPRVGEANSFTIISEEASGTGVRRIIAVTGEEAIRASRTGYVFAERIQAMKSKKGQDLIDAVTAFKNDIAGVVMSASVRAAANVQLEIFAEEITKFIREQNMDLKIYIQEYSEKIIKQLTAENEAKKSQKIHVDILNVGSNGQMLTNAIKAIVKDHGDVAVLLLSAGGEGKKARAVAVAHVPQEMIKNHGFRADEWARAVASVLGGKGGGKPETAQGSGPDVSKVKEAQQKAFDFANVKLGKN